ncbi:unnamed protein product [Closterium sp. Naga37s-1]|nr:unnamed protein product [Closterium sp. Naga37s-1]
MAGESASSAVPPTPRDDGGDSSAARAAPEATAPAPQASGAPGAPGAPDAQASTESAEAGAEAAEDAALEAAVAALPSLLLTPELAEAVDHPDVAAMRSLMEETPEEEVTWLRVSGGLESGGARSARPRGEQASSAGEDSARALWLETRASPCYASSRTPFITHTTPPHTLAHPRASPRAHPQEQGNIALKEGQEQGRKGQRKQQRQAYLKAVDLYSQALSVRDAHPHADIPASAVAVLRGNRAQAHLLLGNHGHALADAAESSRLDATNAKAPFRAAKACLALKRYAEAITWCDAALALPCAAPADLLKLRGEAESKLAVLQAAAARSTAIRSKAERLAACITQRGVRMGRAAYKALSGARKPWVDETGTVHWPVVVVYPEVMGSDLIEDACETDTLGAHVREMFGAHTPPLEWDTAGAYSADAVQLFLRTSAVPAVASAALPRALLEDAAGLTDEDNHAMAGAGEDDGDDGPDWSEPSFSILPFHLYPFPPSEPLSLSLFNSHSSYRMNVPSHVLVSPLNSPTCATAAASGEQQWVQVPLDQPLAKVLTLPNHIVPGVPGESSFCHSCVALVLTCLLA